MSLASIVRAVGGDLYDRGHRAVVPGPGHSRHDRSVSLWLRDGRVIVNSFGRSSWREVLDALRDKGLIDARGQPARGGGKVRPHAPAPAPEMRSLVARRLWLEAHPLTRQLSMVHLRSRGVHRPPPVSAALRHHPELPSAVYIGRGVKRSALLAAVSAASGELCAVEATYLDPGGARACTLRTPRKIIGALPPACAVRLDVAAEELLVGEGVFTTLSASRRFGLPGWALLSTRNLRGWTPPPEVRRVLIAADRGEDGERSSQALRGLLRRSGVSAEIQLPPPGAGDWNEADKERGGEGGDRRAEREDGPDARAGA